MITLYGVVTVLLTCFQPTTKVSNCSSSLVITLIYENIDFVDSCYYIWTLVKQYTLHEDDLSDSY